MSNIDENREWEAEAPNLANLSRKTPFKVPHDYFENLAECTRTSVFLSSLNNTDGFEVPLGYFEGLAQQIEGKIAVENLPSQLESGFSTPKDYFEKLNQNILARTSESPKVKKLWQNNWFKYASAACVAVLLSSGYYYSRFQPEKALATADTQNENLLYDIDESLIREHVLETQNVSNVSQEISNAELEDYILNNLSSSDIRSNL